MTAWGWSGWSKVKVGAAGAREREDKLDQRRDGKQGDWRGGGVGVVIGVRAVSLRDARYALSTVQGE